MAPVDAFAKAGLHQFRRSLDEVGRYADVTATADDVLQYFLRIVREHLLELDRAKL
jgi:hypothetical protein